MELRGERDRRQEIKITPDPVGSGANHSHTLDIPMILPE